MKKMKKAKVISVVALTVVMLAAMTGLAAADQEQLESCDADGTPKFTFYKGETIYVTDKLGVPLTPHPATTGEIWIVENCDWGIGYDQDSLTDYSYHKGSYPDVSVSMIGVNSTGKFIGASVTNGVVAICAVTDLSGNYPDYYDIIYDVNGDGVYDHGTDLVDKLGCQGFGTEIPEFATIAIPVAAILGLVLFFNHRKRRKE